MSMYDLPYVYYVNQCLYRFVVTPLVNNSLVPGSVLIYLFDREFDLTWAQVITLLHICGEYYSVTTLNIKEQYPFNQQTNTHMHCNWEGGESNGVPARYFNRVVKYHTVVKEAIYIYVVTDKVHRYIFHK